jgi:hypothetical protein
LGLHIDSDLRRSDLDTWRAMLSIDPHTDARCVHIYAIGCIHLIGPESHNYQGCWDGFIQ